jgi:hypothetical protein
MPQRRLLRPMSAAGVGNAGPEATQPDLIISLKTKHMPKVLAYNQYFA